MKHGTKPRAPFWKWVRRIFLFLFISHLVYVILLKWIDPPITITQFAAWVSGEGLKRDYVASSAIPMHARLAVIASEDQLFPDHAGLDWKSIEKAQKYNKKKPGRIRGASTISQQVAKNVFLWQGRSWIRKGLEVYFTKLIEWVWGKQRILDVYLNVIEMGKGVYGIEAAAQHHFKKTASKLTRREAALIAGCLPNPKKLIAGKPGPYHRKKATWIQQQMSILEKDPDVLRVIGKAAKAAGKKSGKRLKKS